MKKFTLLNLSFLLIVFSFLIVIINPITTIAQGDADDDGIPDSSDACPGRGNEGGLGVDETGCPYYDADWDGVYDRNDACPWRGDEYGFGIDSSGCPNRAPATQEAPETSEPPTDSPGDNDDTPSDDNPAPEETPDVDPPAATEEPVSTEDPYSQRDEFRDADGDGFADEDDACPWRGNEGGLGVDETGCPYYDADWDGVYDRDDACPWRADEYGFGVGDDGCPLTGLPAVTGSISSPGNGDDVYPPVDIEYMFDEPLPEGYGHFIYIVDPLVDDEHGFPWLHAIETEDGYLLESVVLGLFSDSCGYDFEIRLYVTEIENLPPDEYTEVQQSWDEVNSITVTKVCNPDIQLTLVEADEWVEGIGCDARFQIENLSDTDYTVTPFVHNDFFNGPWASDNIGDSYPDEELFANSSRIIELTLGGREEIYRDHRVTFRFPDGSLSNVVEARCSDPVDS